MTSPPPFLAGLRLSGRRACVVGVGRDAERRVRDLERCGAEVVTVDSAPDATELAGCRVVVICVDDWAEAAEAARAAGALVYVPDVPEASDLVMAAIVRRGDLQVAVSTGGRTPGGARRLKELVDEWLPPTAAAAIDAMAAARAEMRDAGDRLPAYEVWAAALDAGLSAGDDDAAAAAVRAVLGLSG